MHIIFHTQMCHMILDNLIINSAQQSQPLCYRFRDRYSWHESVPTMTFNECWYKQQSVKLCDSNFLESVHITHWRKCFQQGNMFPCSICT